jgi:hypothetical protein
MQGPISNQTREADIPKLLFPNQELFSLFNSRALQFDLFLQQPIF